MPSADRVHRRWSTLLALVAAWSLALLPALSQALAAVTGERVWAEVCTAQGPRWLPLGDAAPDDGAPACACCVASAHTPLLPPATSWTPPALRHEPPPAAGAAAAVVPAWVRPHPRGPPSRSV